MKYKHRSKFESKIRAWHDTGARQTGAKFVLGTIRAHVTRHMHGTRTTTEVVIRAGSSVSARPKPALMKYHCQFVTSRARSMIEPGRTDTDTQYQCRLLAQAGTDTSVAAGNHEPALILMTVLYIQGSRALAPEFASSSRATEPKIQQSSCESRRAI